jgi:hypothetical protein
MTSMPDQPDRDRANADELRMSALLRAVEAPAPAALHQQIAALNFSRQGPRRRRAPALAFVGALAAAVAIVALLVASATTPPTAFAAAQHSALAKPTAPAPHTLVAAGTTIAFPKWSGRGWPSVGTRSDRFDGRIVTTEFYRSYDNGTLGYAIVSGAPLRWGARGHSIARSGSTYTVIRTARAHIVAWVQDGHTCVLASRTAQTATLLKLAVAQDGASPV